MSDLNTTIREYLVREALGGNADGLDENTNLIEEDILDSLGIFSMIEFLEATYSVDIDPAEVVFENFETMGSIEVLVSSKMA